MKKFKNTLHNYEAPPPESVWGKILEELDEEKVVQMPRGISRKSKFLFYGLTAAASLVIIFVSSLFFNKSTEILPKTNNQNASSFSQLYQPNKDSINLNQQILEKIINAPKDEKLLASNYIRNNDHIKKYITIAGAEGQPVKISPKVATLIISADGQYPSKPVWDDKIDKWQQIMLTSTISASSADFMELIQAQSGN